MLGELSSILDTAMKNHFVTAFREMIQLLTYSLGPAVYTQ